MGRSRSVLPMRILLKITLASIFFAPSLLAVSLHDAYQSALSKVETVPIQQARAEQADARVSQLWGAVMPSISLLASYQRQDTAPADSPVASRFTLTDQFNSRITATQPLFRGFAEYAGIRGVKAAQRAQKAQLESTRLTLFSTVASGYYSVLAGEQDRKNLETLIELTERRVKDLRDRARIGRSREGEVLTAQAQLAVQKSQLQAAKLALEQARNQFAQVTGLAPTVTLDPPRSLAIPTKGGNLEDFLSKVEERPDVRALKETLGSAEESVIIARAGHFPSVDLTGNYYLKRAGIQEAVKWDVGVFLTLPLFAGGMVSGRVSEALAAKNEQELLLAQGRRTAQTQVRNAFETLKAGTEQIDALEEAAKLSEKNYQRQTQDYRHGLVTNIDVIQAMNTFQETKRSLDRLRFQTLSAWVDLQVAIGKTP